jgi:hypothetical protein
VFVVDAALMAVVDSQGHRRRNESRAAATDFTAAN